jgi:hypothetical protein
VSQAWPCIWFRNQIRPYRLSALMPGGERGLSGTPKLAPEVTAGAALPKGDAGTSPACLCLTSSAVVPCVSERRFDRGPGDHVRCGCARGQLVQGRAAWCGLRVDIAARCWQSSRGK